MLKVEITLSGNPELPVLVLITRNGVTVDSYQIKSLTAKYVRLIETRLGLEQ